MYFTQYLTRSITIAVLVSLTCSASADTAKERPDWAKYFELHKAIGTIVISDQRTGSRVDGVV